MVVGAAVVVAAAGEKLCVVVVGAASISGFAIWEIVVSAEVVVPLDGDDAEVAPAPAEIVWLPGDAVVEETVAAGGGVLEPMRVDSGLPV